jgi:magnesium chelatase family protein
MLVAAMNPCPCGYYNCADEQHQCICTPQQIRRYHSRLSGPLLDRIDLQVEVPAVPYKELRNQGLSNLDSTSMRKRIEKARQLQFERYKEIPCKINCELSGKWLNKYCFLGNKEHDFLEGAVKKLGLSARAFTRVLRIARTIADLESVQDIKVNHLAEAINYRFLDRDNRL